MVLTKLAGFGCAARTEFPPTTRPITAGNLLEGNWSGSWSSTECDMGGALTCRVEKVREDAYHAKFDAIFAKIFTHKSEVTLLVGNKSGVWDFSGEQDLGVFAGGVYKYQGHSDGADFVCKYDSSMDKGTFKMKRVGATTRPQ